MKIEKLKSSDHAKSKFAAHGEVEIWPEGSVIHYDICGPFNIEAIKAFGHTVAALLNNWQPQGPFVTLTFWQGSMLTSPDTLVAFAHLLQINRAYFPKELMNVWYVPKDLEGRTIMQPKWQALYDATGYPIEIVHSEAEAHERVRWHLDKANRTKDL